MAKQKINFTKANIESLPLPETGKRLEFYDSKIQHLLVRVSSSGRKTFQIYRWHKDKPIRISIGCYPDLSIENVRKEAVKLNAEFAKGNDPADTKREQRQEMTFAELFQEYLDRYAKAEKRTWKADVRNFEIHIAGTLGKKKISSIKKADIAALHSKIGKTHRIQANRCLALVSSIFGRAIKLGFWEKLNPCLGIEKFAEHSRERFLNGDELSRLFKALDTEQNQTAVDYILVSLLTGARKSNVLSMRWSEIDFKEAVWKIPGSKTKNGDIQTIPLNEPTLDVLATRWKETSSFFVFPGTGKTGHFQEPKKAWARVCKSAGLEGAHIHDLRRTMGSWQAKTGASIPIIGKSLGHRSQKTTEVYARLDLDPVRTSMDKAVAAMLEAAKK
jgi:integrase